MPGRSDAIPDDARHALQGLLRTRRLTVRGRALVEQLLDEPEAYFEPETEATSPPGRSEFHGATESLPGGFVAGHYDRDGVAHIEWMSPEVGRLLGVAGESDQRRAVARQMRVLHTEQRPEASGDASRPGQDVRIDARIVDVDGQPRWIRIVTVIRPWADAGYPFVAFALDVTGVRQSIRSDASFRAILRGSRSAFALVDPENRLLWFNDVAIGYARHMGWREPEVGAPMAEIFDGEFYAYYLRCRDQVWQGQTVERRMTFTTRNGHRPTLDLAFLPVRRHDGEIFAVGFTGTDVTRQVHAERAVVESDRILARLPLGVATVDRRGIIQRWRAAAPEMFDLSPDSAEGMSLVDLLVHEHEQRVWPRIVEALADGRELRVEVEARRPDGVQVPIELTLSPIPEPEGHTVVLIEDVTARRALQRQVVESQKMEAVGLFAAGLAHDFNNLLAAVVGHTAMLDLDLPPDDPLRAEVAGIEQTTGRAATLVRSMLGLARQRTGGARTIDFVTLLDQAGPLLSRVSGRCGVERRRSVDSLAVRIDPVQLEQVLVNLVVNARDASPEGGGIVLELTTAVLGGAEARAMTMMPGRVARLRVTDQGQGIPEGLVSRVFDPFFTTKGEGRGTGLGLAICRQILRSHGGEIRIESEEGHGTTVTLWLPCSPDTPSEGPSDEALAMVGGDERILLVEDVADLRQVWSRLLERLGYRVDAAADGVEALALLETESGFDMLVSDVVMPRVGGLAVARRFREVHPDRPILMVSAYPGNSFDTGSLLDLHARLVRKPLTGPVLARHIRKMLSGR